jgi:regulator of sigma E protease
MGTGGGLKNMFTQVINILYAIIPPLLVLGVLIFIHELGHFAVAKLSGVTVEKFSLGFGKELLKLKIGETEYIISLIPLGGFVQMAGETIEDKKDTQLKPGDFLAQGPFKRFMIVVAGPVMNILLAFVFFFIVLFAGGASMSNVVGGLIEDHPAQQAGILPADRIIAINGERISSWPDMQLKIRTLSEPTEEMVISIERAGEIIDLRLRPLLVEAIDRNGEPAELPVIGVMPLSVGGDFFLSLKEAFINVVVVSRYIFDSLGKLVTGQISTKHVSGPIAIMVISSDVAKQGVIALISFTALLSLSLAIFNLLPIPALDGSHLFFILCEVILRKPISFKLQERIAQVGFVCLMALMILVSYNDVVNNLSLFKKLIPFIQ